MRRCVGFHKLFLPAAAPERLVQVSAPHFTAGLVVREGRVVRAAPILRWAEGRAWAEVAAYFRRKGWTT